MCDAFIRDSIVSPLSPSSPDPSFVTHLVSQTNDFTSHNALFFGQRDVTSGGVVGGQNRVSRRSLLTTLRPIVLQLIRKERCAAVGGRKKIPRFCRHLQARLPPLSPPLPRQVLPCGVCKYFHSGFAGTGAVSVEVRLALLASGVKKKKTRQPCCSEDGAGRPPPPTSG